MEHRENMPNGEGDMPEGSYMNPQVEKIEQDGGTFDRGEEIQDNIEKDEREMIELENGARY